MVKQTYELIDTLSEQRIGRKTNYTNFLSNTSEKFATIHVSSHSEQKQKLKKNIQVQTSTKIRKGSPEQIRNVTTLMDRGGVQQAMKKVVADCGIKKKFLTNKDRSWLGYRLARSILVR
jgi:hypothetical protein